jgi:urea transporter
MNIASAGPGTAWTRAVDAVRPLLRGVAEIFLQSHAGAGACLLAAIAWQSSTLAAGCLLGAATGTLWGALRADRTETVMGLHGYNGALVGIGVLVALPPSPLAWGLVIALAGLSTALAQAWRRRLPGSPYTAPFILMIWLLLAVMPVAGWAPVAATLPAEPAQGLAAVAVGLLRGVGQVMFLDDPGSGALCVLGLAWAAPGAALRALGASAAMLAAAWAAGFPMDALRMGLYGFNAVLVAEAIHQALPGRRIALWAGVGLSLLIMRGFQWADLPALTAPFVLAAWMVRCAHRALSLFKA